MVTVSKYFKFRGAFMSNVKEEKEEKVTQKMVPCKICQSVEAVVAFKECLICEACVTYIKSTL